MLLKNALKTSRDGIKHPIESQFKDYLDFCSLAMKEYAKTNQFDYERFYDFINSDGIYAQQYQELARPYLSLLSDYHQFVFNIMDYLMFKRQDEHGNLNESRNLESIFDNASWKKNDDESFNPLIESERDYNHDMEQKQNFALMDRQDVYVERQDNFEFCDLIYRGDLAEGKLDLIHIKEGLSSSKLSHLFNQGEVSAKSLLNPRLKEKILEKYNECTNGKEWKSEYILFFENVDPHNFRIVYAIIDTHEELKIPFFSKVVFRARAKLLKMQGFKVAIVKIKTEEKSPRDHEQEEQGRHNSWCKINRS
mgnify:CR=1 FL=1